MYKNENNDHFQSVYGKPKKNWIIFLSLKKHIFS